MAPPTVIRLDEAFEQIIAEIADRLNAATAPGGLLEDVTEVVIGERARARPDPPYLWVAIGAATATQARAQHERWEAAVLLSSFVQSEQPEDGWTRGFRLAARARSVAKAGDRTLGLGFVEDVQSAELGPLGQFNTGRRFGAFARVNVRFNIAEPTT